jgi:ATP-binding protein involved in chromosome partitioning
MSTHICSKCGHEEHIFGAGGGAAMCKDYNVDLLGSLPLDISIREQSDTGTPTVIAEPNSSIANTYKQIARSTASKLSQLALDHSSKFPNIVIQNT